MKRLTKYIIEQLQINEDKINKDNLLNELNKHSDNLDDFVKELNKALKHADKDDNAKLWMGAIKDLFDGENGNQYKAKNHVSLKISELYPTQSEIDIENSAKWISKDWVAKSVGNMFKKEAFGKSFPVPVLVYKDDEKYWIIDGHHRWSQVGLINYNASVDCMVVEGPETVQDFLKITQGVISSVLASDNKNNGKSGNKQLPMGKANPQNNIFGDALKGNKLKEKISKMCIENSNICKLLQETLLNNHIIDNTGKFIVEAKNNQNEFINNLSERVMNNRDKMIENKQDPPKWAAPRPVMPQSDAAGPNDPNDPNDGNPDNEGSALYKILYKGKFPNIGK